MNKSSGFIDLLKGPLKILSQNGKLMAFTATIYLILYTVSYIVYTSSANPFAVDLVTKLLSLTSTQPGTPEFNALLVAIREDTGIILGLETVYIVFYFFVVTFAQTTVNIIASCYYNGDYLSLKDLIMKVARTWTRPFVTMLYVQLLAIGYTSIMIFTFVVISLLLSDHLLILIPLVFVLVILFLTFNIYLSVVWSLGVVVSVVEDTYGLQALGKARELVKGKRAQGFFLNVFFMLVMIIILIIGMILSPAMPIVVGVIQYLFIGVMSMFMIMAYNVFYFQCKDNMKISSGGSEYSRIPAAPLVDENLP